MEEEQRALLERYKNAKTGKESMRYHAILLVKTGSTIVYVSKIFYVDEETVRGWVKKWDEDREVRDKTRSGNPAKLTDEQEGEICKIVDENNPEKQGYNTSVWDCVELKGYVRGKYGIEISAETIRRILKRHRFSYIKAEYLFTKRDNEERNRFIEEILSLYEVNKHNTIIMFGDEMSSKLHPKLPYVWTRNGTPLIPTTCSHKRVNTIGAIEPVIGKKVIATYDRNDADSFVDFLSNLEKDVEENIILILDNYPVHHSKKVKLYLDKIGKISLKFLPTYSPDLNPIEWLWGYMRKKFLNGYPPPDIVALKQRLKMRFDSISPDVVRKICPLDIIRKHLVT